MALPQVKDYLGTSRNVVVMILSPHLALVIDEPSKVRSGEQPALKFVSGTAEEREPILATLLGELRTESGWRDFPAVMREDVIVELGDADTRVEQLIPEYHENGRNGPYLRYIFAVLTTDGEIRRLARREFDGDRGERFRTYAVDRTDLLRGRLERFLPGHRRILQEVLEQRPDLLGP